MYLIMNDEVDYPVMFYPTHIISKIGTVLPLYIGAPNTIPPKGVQAVGLYVKDEHYDLIRHDKAYLLIHDPNVTDDDIDNIEWEKVSDVKENTMANREHLHMWRDYDMSVEPADSEVKGHA